LLPARWQEINAYGIRIKYRTYDAEALNPLRRQRSGIKAKKDLWEIHHDPYDVSRIWVRDHHNGGWITAFWKHLHRVPMPFGEMAWDHARHGLPDAAEEEIAEAVKTLLERAHRGPDTAGPKLSRRDRRVVARTRVTSPPAQPTDPGTPADGGVSDANADHATNEDDTAMAKVIPLPIFDPFDEARKRW
jgi:hypothetical protein